MSKIDRAKSAWERHLVKALVRRAEREGLRPTSKDNMELGTDRASDLWRVPLPMPSDERAFIEQLAKAVVAEITPAETSDFSWYARALLGFARCE